MKNSWKFLSGLRRTLMVSVAGLALSTASASATERVMLGEPAGLSQAALSSPVLRAKLQELASTAQEEGSVRVMVGVRTAFAPEGKLPAATADQQRREIASTQAVVLSRLPQVVQKNSTVRRFASIPYLAMSVTAQELRALEQMPEVTSIQKDKLVQPTLVNSVPFIGGTTAWSSGISYSGAGQAVAVLDTGVDSEHPFFVGKVVAEACYSTTDASKGSVSVCPEGVQSSTDTGSGMHCTLAGCEHGTHVAGIVAGNNGSRSAPAGVAKGASIIAMQVFSKFTTENACGVGKAPCVSGYDSDIVMALERVLALQRDPIYKLKDKPIAAVNMSLGGGKYSSQSICDSENSATKAVIDSLRSVNIATIVSSGNAGYIDAMGAPGCISSAISVGSTWAKAGSNNSCLNHNLGASKPDDISCFSNSTPFLSLLAPGSSISSAFPKDLYESISGTSMAAPHVAGAWAVLKGAKPTATVDELFNAFVITGKLVVDPRNGVTKPRIDVAEALKKIVDSYKLSVVKSGDGTITSTPAGIDCGASCSANFVDKTSVTLTAVPFNGNAFTGWGGACAGAASTCTVTMNAASSVTASFAATQATRLLALSKSGQGVVTSTPSGIYCDVSCGSASFRFPGASNIVLTATPSVGSAFVGWSGACSGTGQCHIAAGTGTANVIALFNASGGESGPVTLLNQLNLAAASGSSASFVVQVPPNATNLVVTTSGGTGDVDLYVKYGALPTLASHDCVSARSGNAEMCGFATPRSGNYHILLNSFASYKGATLRVTYRVPSSKATLSVTKTGQGTVQSVSSMATQVQSTGGLSSPSIVGGEPAQLSAWPWQVRLSIATSQGTFLCGGSLVSDQWVLTAAHCIEDAGSTVSAANITVRAGSVQKDSGGVVVGVSRVITHPAYEPVTTDNDIALLRLSSPLPLSKTISPIAPLSASQEQQLAANNTLATVTGWGTTRSGGSTSAVLMQAQVPLISSGDCANQSAYPSSKLSSNMICAGYPQGGKDSCQGDSGGPLVVPSGQGGHVLAGIVSWGAGCAAPDFPGVYTRVANYQPWLQTQTQLALGAPLLNCGDACLAIVDTNTTITLRAQASNGSNFMGWGGACSYAVNSDICTVTLDGARSVTATFSSNGFDPLRDPADFVTQQYQDLLGRKLDSASLNEWVGFLNSGVVTRAQIVESLMNSDEFRGRLNPIVRLYTAYFKRLPDYDGLMYWLDRMHPRSGTGSNLMHVSEAFAQSNEFVQMYGQLNNTAFITRVYQNVLGRIPEAEGYAYWMGRLNSGMPRGEVMVGFSESIENQQTTAQSLLVTTAYVGLLRRAPNYAEQTRWLQDIQAGHIHALNLIDSLLKSPEYAARF